MLQSGVSPLFVRLFFSASFLSLGCCAAIFLRTAPASASEKGESQFAILQPRLLNPLDEAEQAERETLNSETSVVSSSQALSGDFYLGDRPYDTVATNAAALLPESSSLVQSRPTTFQPTLSVEPLPPPTFRTQAPRPTEQPDRPPSQRPLPEPTLPPDLPDQEELLPLPDPLADPTEIVPDRSERRITVTRFEFVDNTAFSDEELATAVESYTGREITLTELFEARSTITQKYVDAGFVTSGAFIPPQQIQDGTIAMNIVEGTLDEIVIQRPEDIQVEFGERLNDSYVINRIRVAAGEPLNRDDLLEALRLLQLDPRIQTLRAELSAGTRLGSSTLTVDLAEASTADLLLEVNNERSPSVGSFRQQIELGMQNLIGNGESLNVSYARTTGSNDIDGSLQFFLNPRNGTLTFSGGTSNSEVIEEPFDLLDIRSESYFLELSYRQPLIRTLDEELAVGVTASHQQNRSSFLPEPFGPVPLTLFGAEADGEVRVTALRFFQDWTRRREGEVFAARSQFSFGADILDPTISDEGLPDSRFFSWRGQAQWARRLSDDALLIVKGDLQFADNELLTLEQFGIGGARTVRGYRQDLLLTDNGILASAEVRLPIVRTPSVNGLLQVVPFLDIGKGWNISAEDPDPSTLVGVGVGLLWQMDRLSAQFEWGIPLVNVETREDNSLQENGFYFSLVFNPF